MRKLIPSGLVGNSEKLNEILNRYLPEVGDPADEVTAAGTLTVTAQPTLGDTFTIGNKTYTFIANGAALTGQKVNIGANLAASQANIVAAVNGTDGVNTANEYASLGAFSTNVSAVTSRKDGAAGNSTPTTETFTAGTNVFAAATLTGGVTGTNDDPITKIRISADGTKLFVKTAAGTGVTGYKEADLSALS